VPNISQIPLNKVPFLDPKNPDLVSRQWYRFLNNLFSLTGSGSSDVSLSDVQLGPTATQVDEMSVAVRRIDDLFAAPASTPHTSASRAGDFYDTTTQTAAVINTAYAVTLNTTIQAKGIALGSPTSRITVYAPGRYIVSVILQYGKTGGAAGTAVTWLRKNGADVAGSGARSYVTTTNVVSSQTFSYVIEAAAGDYIESMWAASDTAIQLQSTAASAPYPLIPSARVSIFNLTG
jgi:hypothetical protein